MQHLFNFLMVFRIKPKRRYTPQSLNGHFPASIFLKQYFPDGFPREWKSNHKIFPGKCSSLHYAPYYPTDAARKKTCHEHSVQWYFQIPSQTDHQAGKCISQDMTLGEYKLNIRKISINLNSVRDYWPPEKNYGWDGIAAPPGPGDRPGLSRFFSSCDSQRFVELSSLRQLTNVWSFSWSGRHWRNASRALPYTDTEQIFYLRQIIYFSSCFL